jgi:hypothetical protein
LAQRTSKEQVKGHLFLKSEKIPTPTCPRGFAPWAKMPTLNVGKKIDNVAKIKCLRFLVPTPMFGFWEAPIIMKNNYVQMQYKGPGLKMKLKTTETLYIFIDQQQPEHALKYLAQRTTNNSRVLHNTIIKIHVI